MRIAIGQINPIIGDFSRNAERISSFAETARDRSCDLVVFSELAISGYPPRDLLEKHDFFEANLATLERLIETIRGIGVICGTLDANPDAAGKSLFNAAVLFEDGKVLTRARKRLLPTYDVFDETRYFEPGTENRPFVYKGRRLGLTICEDAWNDKDIFRRRLYRSDPVAQMADTGLDLLVNISASPFHLGKEEFRRRMLSSIARKYNIPLVYANQAGGNDSILFDGRSTVFNPAGEIVALARDFDEDLVVFDSDTGEGDIHPVSGSDTEGMLRALTMGTRDYVTKCGFSKVVIGLSGGIDSALTAAIAARALGSENVSTVFMPSRYTSEDNYEDTRQLAATLGVSLRTVPIDEIFDAFLRFLSPSFDRSEPGITEQNLQARIRGTILMAFSNREGSILLSTGNKSELAVGYCTLYGDMNGGLAVISDVPKVMVYDLARHINRDREVIPRRILDKAPSAELKPDQADADDLPPYGLLDAVLRGYIEELKGAEDLAREGFDRGLVEEIIRRVDRNEYKRHQAAPGLKVTSKAFGIGRRYPLAQRYIGK